jgi:UDP-glucuronate 4-epimerase
MKRIFISGISGFIGFHLGLALRQRGDLVFGCDNFNSYYDPSLKRQRASLLAETGITVLECDVIDKDRVKAEIARLSISHFVHLAAQAGVRHSLKHPESYVHSNLNGFVQILEALSHFPHIKFIYASSSSVYGLNSKIPFAETDPVEQPASFYAATKRCNELIAHAYHHIHGIHCTGLRFFTVYGPWGRPDMAYYSFSKAILNEEPISVFGEGKLMRDFTYIDDIIKGSIAAIDYGAANEIFNLGDHSPVSVLELISILESQLGKKAIISFQPMPPGDVSITYADITKSQKILGFEPTVPLYEGLKKFTDWYLNYRVNWKAGRTKKTIFPVAEYQ